MWLGGSPGCTRTSGVTRSCCGTARLSIGGPERHQRAPGPLGTCRLGILPDIRVLNSAGHAMYRQCMDAGYQESGLGGEQCLKEYEPIVTHARRNIRMGQSRRTKGGQSRPINSHIRGVSSRPNPTSYDADIDVERSSSDAP